MAFFFSHKSLTLCDENKHIRKCLFAFISVAPVKDVAHQSQPGNVEDGLLHLTWAKTPDVHEDRVSKYGVQPWRL